MENALTGDDNYYSQKYETSTESGMRQLRGRKRSLKRKMGVELTEDEKKQGREDRKKNISNAISGEENYFSKKYSIGKLKQMQRIMKKEDGIPLTNEEKQEAKEWRRERMRAAAEGREDNYFSKNFTVEELRKKLLDTTNDESQTSDLEINKKQDNEPVRVITTGEGEEINKKQDNEPVRVITTGEGEEINKKQDNQPVRVTIPEGDEINKKQDNQPVRVITTEGIDDINALDQVYSESLLGPS